MASASSLATSDPALSHASQDKLLPDNPTAEAILAQWDPNIRRASRAVEKSYGTRSASADDFAQEARVRVLRALHRNPDQPAAYVRAIISNSVSNSVRAELPHLLKVDRLAEVLPDGEHEREPLKVELPPEDGLDPLLARLIGHWVATLPIQLQKIYETLYVQDLTQHEAAVALGVSQARVSQLHAELLRRGQEALAPVVM